jgi:hypothetical protein
MPDDLVRASGLWVKTGKNDRKFFSGQTNAEIPEGSKLLIFKNDKRENESQPAYTLFYVASEQPPMRRAEPGQRGQVGGHDVDDSDIPF